jgi:hypothetical protein
MYAVTVRFHMPPDTDWERLRQAMVRRAFEGFRSVPGLRSTAFVFSPERQEIGGNYVWETQDDAEAYLRSPAWRGALERWGTPRLEGAEVCACIEDGDLVYPRESSAWSRPLDPPPAPAPY